MNKIVMLAQAIAVAGALLSSLGAAASTTHSSGHGDGGHNTAALIGKPGSTSRVSRTIEINMTDAMRFTPSNVEVNAGETIRFKVTNSGKIRHEMVLGTEEDLNGHYQMMLNAPGMRHEEPNSVSLESGKVGEIVWQFDKAGRVAFACLEPGHYPAGMKGAVSVK